jgi:hypothetical protein
MIKTSALDLLLSASDFLRFSEIPPALGETGWCIEMFRQRGRTVFSLTTENSSPLLCEISVWRKAITPPKFAGLQLANFHCAAKTETYLSLRSHLLVKISKNESRRFYGQIIF